MVLRLYRSEFYMALLHTIMNFWKVFRFERYNMRPLKLLIFLIFIFSVFTRVPYAETENDKLPKSKTIFGRLPGVKWLEHSPPLFKSEQSFEARDMVEKILILLYAS